jgi:hypothetical protein
MLKDNSDFYLGGNVVHVVDNELKPFSQFSFFCFFKKSFYLFILFYFLK